MNLGRVTEWTHQKYGAPLTFPKLGSLSPCFLHHWWISRHAVSFAYPHRIPLLRQLLSLATLPYLEGAVCIIIIHCCTRYCHCLHQDEIWHDLFMSKPFIGTEAGILKTIDWNVRRHTHGRSYKAHGWGGISFLLHEFGADYVRQIFRIGGPWTSDSGKFWGIHTWQCSKRSQQKGCFFQELLIILRKVLISHRIFQCWCVFSQEWGPIQNMVFWNMTM